MGIYLLNNNFFKKIKVNIIKLNTDVYKKNLLFV